MKLQVISQYFYPDAFLINQIVEELARRGHRVNVLTGLPDYATGRVPEEYRRRRRRRDTLWGADIRRVPIIARRRGVLFRALNYASFMLNSWRHARFGKKPDCDALFVYQTSPVFQALPGVTWKKRTGKKLVLYCCDLWPESLKAWNIRESGPLFRIVRNISGSLYRRCDVVAVSSKPFRQYLIDVCGVEADRIVYLPQHAEDSFAEIAGVYEDNGVFDFLFAGNLGAVQNLDCVLRAAARLREDAQAPPFAVHLVGDGSETDALKALAAELGVSDVVRFHGRHPFGDMAAFYKMADAFLLTLRGGDFIGQTLPSKAQSYLCAGKPVLGAVDGAGHDLIREADCGGAVGAGDDAGLAALMRECMDRPAAYREKGLNGRRYFEAHFTKDQYIRSLLSLLTPLENGVE